jgi:hypothetical protein
MSNEAGLGAAGLGIAIITGAAYGLNKVGLLNNPNEVFKNLAETFQGVIGDNPGVSKQYYSRPEVFRIAEQIIAANGFTRVTPLIATTVSTIESGVGNVNNAKAYRFEPHINDASYGLMQVLYNTAKWLHDDMGYRGYALNSGEDMYRPEVGIYFGIAYLDWLKKSYGGTLEQWIRRYNGGPNGHARSSTEAYWKKFNDRYKTVIAELQTEGINYA